RHRQHPLHRRLHRPGGPSRPEDVTARGLCSDASLTGSHRNPPASESEIKQHAPSR
ncbi:unnamed protein product, partial [Musa hybrid cultivar]